MRPTRRRPGSAAGADPRSGRPGGRTRLKYSAIRPIRRDVDLAQESGGAVVDERLAPAGLTRLLGSYGAGRASVLAAAAVLVVGACLLRAFTSAPALTVGLACIVAVTLVASEFGTRAGLRFAAAAIAVMSACAALGLSGEGAVTIAGRAVVLLFLAPVVGRATSAPPPAAACSSSCSRRRPTRSTSRTSTGATCSSTAPTARLIGQPADEIIGRTNSELLPRGRRRGRRRTTARCSAAEPPVVL